MATTPTNKPVGSNDIKDLLFNSEKFDEVVNSESLTYVDRKDNTRLTIKGLEEAAVSAGPTVEAAIRANEQANEAKKNSDEILSATAQYIESAKVSADASSISAEESAESALQAKTAAASAEAVIDIQGTYPDVGTGLANTTDKEYFRVPNGTGSNTAFTYYVNDLGNATVVTETPSLLLIEKVKEQADNLDMLVMSNQSNDSIITATDLAGFHLLQFGADYFISEALKLKYGDAVEGFSIQDEFGFSVIPKIAFKGTADNDVIIVDEYGFWLFSAIKAGQGNSGTTDDKSSLIMRMNTDALARANAVKDKVVTGIQRPVFDYNIVITYGQSLASAAEGWPAKSKIAQEVGNVLMFGGSVRPSTRQGSSWSPVGGAGFNDLIAVVQQNNDNAATVMTDAAVAALAAGAQNEGESFDVSAVNTWRGMQNDLRGVASNPDRKIVVLNCACAGRSVEELSRGAAGNHFNRIVEAVTKTKAHINTISPGATVGVAAILYAQGEWNYLGNNGTQDRETFLNLTKQLRLDINQYVCKNILGQNKPPAFITYQTGASFTQDVTNMSVGMAQIDMANNTDGCWMASPCYQVTDKNGHLDPNGYRWLGVQFGKVMHKIIDKSEDFKPLQPIKAVIENNDVLVSFLVPSPPLQFKPVWQVLTEYEPASKGFRITDALGDVPVSSVSVAAAAVVEIKLGREISGDAFIWYAPKTAVNGNGNLCDSDNTVSPFNYEYTEGTGQYPAANIPALVNKPYPLNNFCVAFKLPVNKSGE